ncbi:MAG: hypothetical protein CM15mP71_2660 [Candidatus Poseidoniales archaeon]|nr:MAG: hypothetical protein CM15mP71_2660 [Candidatus Poseidoniales archaeon]
MAVIKSIQSDRLKLKWPNDILIDERKLLGTVGNPLKIKKIVLGIGINLHASDKVIDGRELVHSTRLKNWISVP